MPINDPNRNSYIFSHLLIPVKQENIVEKLGLNDKIIQEHLKKNPETAISLAKTLISLHSKMKKENDFFDGVRALGQRVTGGEYPYSVPGRDFSFNKSFVIVAMLLVFLFIFGLILYVNIFYYP